MTPDLELEAREKGFENYLKQCDMQDDYDWDTGDDPTLEGAYDDGWHDAGQFFAEHPELLPVTRTLEQRLTDLVRQRESKAAFEEYLQQHLPECDICREWLSLCMVEPIHGSCPEDYQLRDAKQIVERVSFWRDHKDKLIAHGIDYDPATEHIANQ